MFPVATLITPQPNWLALKMKKKNVPNKNAPGKDYSSQPKQENPPRE